MEYPLKEESNAEKVVVEGKVPFPMKMEEIIQEYCSAKRASLLGYGPPIVKTGEFDLVCYSDRVEFGMEKCITLTDRLQQVG